MNTGQSFVAQRLLLFLSWVYTSRTSLFVERATHRIGIPPITKARSLLTSINITNWQESSKTCSDSRCHTISRPSQKCKSISMWHSKMPNIMVICKTSIGGAFWLNLDSQLIHHLRMTCGNSSTGHYALNRHSSFCIHSCLHLSTHSACGIYLSYRYTLLGLPWPSSSLMSFAFSSVVLCSSSQLYIVSIYRHCIYILLTQFSCCLYSCL